MLKKIRDGVVIQTSKINYLVIDEDPEEDEFPVVVNACFDSGDVIPLEWFATKFDAEKYLENFVAEINQR